jgi:undecaprenyl-phosphate 4-deoxy-4-formamido-L-arabinose transferase
MKGCKSFLLSNAKKTIISYLKRGKTHIYLHMKKLLSFVIPCYNSEKTIEPVTSEIISIVDKSEIYDYEIILVNDYSRDNVWEAIKKLCDNNKKIRGISFAKNFGQQSALLAGYRLSKGEIIVSMDDDGQAPLEFLNEMLNKLNGDNYDIVYGCYETKMHSPFRNFGSFVNRKMGEIMLNRPKDMNPTSFFVVRKFVVDEISRFENCYPYISGLVFRSTINISSILVKHRQRIDGTSGYTFKKLVSLWFNGFTAFSVKPLRVATFIGFIFSIFGFLYGSYIVVNKILNPDILVGYSSLMAVLLFMGGLLMLLLGIIGEYVGRIYINQNKSPQYLIRERINLDV